MLFRRTQIWADQCFGQDVHFLASVFRDFAFLCWIHKNQLFFHRMFQCLIQHHMNALHHARTQAVLFQFRLVFLLHTAAFEQLTVKLLDLQHHQLFQLHISELRNDVVINRVVVKFLGRVSHLRLDVNGVPELQPLFERVTACFHWIEFFAVLDGSTQLVFDFCLCLAEHIFRDRLSVCIIARRIFLFRRICSSRPGDGEQRGQSLAALTAHGRGLYCLQPQRGSLPCGVVRVAGYSVVWDCGPTSCISPKEHQKERCGHFSVAALLHFFLWCASEYSVVGRITYHSLNRKSPCSSGLYKRRHCLPSVTAQTRLLLFNKCLWLHKQKIKSHHSSTRSAISLASLTASAS